MVSAPKKRFNVAVVAGDGIGKEIMPEELKVIETVGRKVGIEFVWDEPLVSALLA